MKWTTLRLNMLPITAVQVEYACQTLTNLHNALVDAKTKQSSPLSKSFPNKIIPLFASAENFLPITIQKSKIPVNEPQPQKMTYNKLVEEYEKLKESIQCQIKELNKFYIKNSHDSSASLFHMLRLRLERVTFDCNGNKNQMKKVLTTAEQEKQYTQIAKHFDSKKSKTSIPINSKHNPDTNYLESWDTFKTENYAGYQNDSLEISQNQFFDIDNNQYEKLNFDFKPQKNLYISQSNLKSKSKNSLSPNSKNQKHSASKSPISKTLLKKQATSQLTIATERDNQKGRIPTKEEKKNLTKIQTERSSYKNLKVLTNNNVPTKNTNKKQIFKKMQRQSFSNTVAGPRNLKNIKINDAIDNGKGYGFMNQNKVDMKKKNANFNENQVQKSKIVAKDLSITIEEKKQKSPSKNLIETNQKVSPMKSAAQDQSKKKIEFQKSSPLKSPEKQDNKNDKEVNDLKQMLISSGSELRFTIKMSRQEYQSLLEYKNKMNNKKT